MPRYNPDQAPIREGEVEYITVQDGRRREVRRWLPEEEEWSYTRLGRSYYRQRPVQWLVEVPVEVRAKKLPKVARGVAPRVAMNASRRPRRAPMRTVCVL